MTRPDQSLAKRAISGLYSWAAEGVYDRVVVKAALPFFGGNINEIVRDHGHHAVTAADGRPILDMPVGTAYFTVDVARVHPGLVVGSDIADGMVRRARDVAAEAGADNLAVVRADAHHLPFRDGAFGAVLSSNGLQVIPGFGPTMTELARVVAPGGTLLIAAVSLPVRNAPRSRRERLPGILRHPGDVARRLRELGLEIESQRRTRLGYSVIATKRTRTSQSIKNDRTRSQSS